MLNTNSYQLLKIVDFSWHNMFIKIVPKARKFGNSDLVDH